jgi:hypothetical protein
MTALTRARTKEVRLSSSYSSSASQQYTITLHTLPIKLVNVPLMNATRLLNAALLGIDFGKCRQKEKDPSVLLFLLRAFRLIGCLHHPLSLSLALSLDLVLAASIFDSSSLCGHAWFCGAGQTIIITSLILKVKAVAASTKEQQGGIEHGGVLRRDKTRSRR